MLQKAASVRGILIVIAILLIANLLVTLLAGSANHATLVTQVGAQNAAPLPLPMANKVQVVQGFSIANMKDVVSLGDGRTFVVSNANGFMVYQVDAR